jgi:hypothetical protein
MKLFWETKIFHHNDRQCLFNFICTLDLEVFNFSEKMALFATYLELWTELSTCQFTNLKRRWLYLFCNYYHIQCVCNHSTALVVIFFLLQSFILPHFWHIQNFIVNLDTMPLSDIWKDKSKRYCVYSSGYTSITFFSLAPISHQRAFYAPQ